MVTIIWKHSLYLQVFLRDYCWDLLVFLIFVNDLLKNLKLEIEPFADGFKLLVRPLSKEITQMNLNKLSYCEDIWKLEFNIEKFKELDVGSKNIKEEYELSNRNIKKSKLRIQFKGWLWWYT